MSVSETALFLFVLLFLVSPSSSQELETLLEFKSGLEKKTESDAFTTWTKQNHVCNFTGIVCKPTGGENGLITEINLSQKQLKGVIKFDSICSLKSIEKIDLGENSLDGKVSESLRNCSNLKYLDLGENHFSGEVPDLSTLQKLEFLNFNNSGISGNFPWKSLENLKNLTFLSLGDNPLNPNPFPVEVLGLKKLYWLYLTNCSISGEIPDEIGNLVLLENLELSDNFLVGDIPKGIVKLNKLWQLELYNNSLTGKLPLGFGNLTNLANFDASQNKLGGDLSELRFLKKIVSLQLMENQFTGEIPEEFGDLKNLEELSLYRNNFTGQIPGKIGSWGNFLYIDVSENFFTGPIPVDMCRNGNLSDLLILQNNFSGEIPREYGNCKSLTRFRVSRNSLSGIVPPEIWGLPNLEVMDLSMNLFEGPLSSDIANAKSLGLLLLAENRFTGELPDSISQASSLVSIQLSLNQFSGEIPASLGEFKKLGSLYLDSNKFSGEIPHSLGLCVSLNDLNLARNSLSGSIPDEVGFLPSLNSLNLSGNKLSGNIPRTLSTLRLSLLDLSNNQLVGQIPQALSIGSFQGNPGLCSVSIKNFQPCSSVYKKSRSLQVFIYCFIAAVLLLVVLMTAYLIQKLSKRTLSSSLKSNVNWDMKSYRILSFTEKEIIDEIKTENLIGKGGSGNVYKVVLRNGETLAVKHIWTPPEKHSSQSSGAILTKHSSRSREYDAEVTALSGVSHVNVVKLYCSITSEDSNLLVYEYFPNGSLWDRLHTCRKIEIGWEARYSIAVGAADGLEYLHHGCDRPVVHRDVKSSNILLDDELKPKIADFGLAKIVQPGGEWTHAIAGTFGYIAPEYAYTWKVNEKSDVYSFGVVLMELVTGKRPVEPEFGENTDIVAWVYNNIKKNENLINLVDPIISVSSRDDALKVMKIAVLCTSNVPAIRPSMRMVVRMLEEAEPCKLSEVVVVHKTSESSPN